MQKTGEIFEPESEPQGLWAIDDTIVPLPTNLRFTARTTGRSSPGPTLTASWIPQAMGAWARHTLTRTFGTPLVPLPTCRPREDIGNLPVIASDPEARPERFELPTFGSVDRRSIQLSYGRLGAILAR